MLHNNHTDNYLQVKVPGGAKIPGGMPNSLVYYSGMSDSQDAEFPVTGSPF